MKKKMLCLVTALLLGVLLCACSGSSAEKMFGVKLPSGDKLKLYMDRADVEKIMGDEEYELVNDVYDYGYITLGYTDGLLSYITFDGDSTVSLLNGLSLGDTNYDKYDFTIYQDHDGNAFYKNNNGKYELTDTFDTNMEFQDGVTVSIFISSEKKVKSVMILDSYVASVRRLDG